MGEYAFYNNSEIKIGTCEQMYYLRADQVSRIQPAPNSVNPRLLQHAESIRFRFPFPQEDAIQPGNFDDYDKGLAVWGLEPHADVEHNSLQFTRNYPTSGGILLSTPCPESVEGKASGLKFAYNGYSGKVEIHSQRLQHEQLCLVLRCGSCGAMWREDTLADAQPVIDRCREIAASEWKDEGRAKFWNEVAQRIEDGYTKPNFWSKQVGD